MNFQGKKILVLGVANEKSIAWEITKQLSEQGAELCLTYLNEALEKRVRPLAASINCENVLPCDVQNDQDLDSLFSELKQRWGTIDGIVHSVAFANKDDLAKPFSETSRDGFKLAMDVSAYSLIAVAGRAKELMKEKGGAIITLTYLGSLRAIPNYNVMGVAKAALESSVRYLGADLGQYNIRVNAISAGPIKTLAASGIPNFRELLNTFAESAPLKRNTTQEDVAKTALFLLSDYSSGVTSEITYVDCGFSTVGLV